MTTAVDVKHRQRTNALARANHIRSTRARILNEMQGLPRPESAAMAVDVLRHPPAEFIGMPVAQLLGRVQGVGAKRVKAVLRTLTVCAPGSNPRIGQLTARQQDEVRVFLERHGNYTPVKRGAS